MHYAVIDLVGDVGDCGESAPLGDRRNRQEEVFGTQ